MVEPTSAGWKQTVEGITAEYLVLLSAETLLWLVGDQHSRDYTQQRNLRPISYAL